MRKLKVSIKGTVTLKDSEKTIECPIYSLGDLLKPNFNGMLNGSLINNQMFLMELQNAGLKLSKIFHYRNSTEKAAQKDEYISLGKTVLYSVLKDNYKCFPVDIQLFLEEDYDVDYCELSLEEIKADLSNDEIQEVLKDMANYKPTTKTQRKMDIFFG